MSESTMIIDEWGAKLWKNSAGQIHRTDGPAVECLDKSNAWYVNDKFLGCNDKGFWALWDTLAPEQKKDLILLSYLPGDFNV